MPMQTIELPAVLDVSIADGLEVRIITALLTATPLTLLSANVEYVIPGVLPRLWDMATRFQSAGIDLLFDSPPPYFLDALIACDPCAA